MSNAQLLTRIRREFQDHPGIAVTLSQAQILWSVSHDRCAQVFETLISEGFLRQVDDVYMWGDAPPPRFRRRDVVRLAP